MDWNFSRPNFVNPLNTVQGGLKSLPLKFLCNNSLSGVIYCVICLLNTEWEKFNTLFGFKSSIHCVASLVQSSSTGFQLLLGFLIENKWNSTPIKISGVPKVFKNNFDTHFPLRSHQYQRNICLCLRPVVVPQPTAQAAPLVSCRRSNTCYRLIAPLRTGLQTLK